MIIIFKLSAGPYEMLQVNFMTYHVKKKKDKKELLS